MPLNTQLMRDGEPVTMVWDGGALDCLLSVCLGEATPEVVYAANGKSMGELLRENKIVSFSGIGVYYLSSDAPIYTQGRQKIENDYTFNYQDADPPRSVEIKAGDEFHMWRSM